MSNPDLLLVAGEAAERLERDGLVACGRRVDGVTRVDFWTRDGKAHSFVMRDASMTADDAVATCRSMAGLREVTPRISHLS